MNYQQFLSDRDARLSRTPEAIDAGELNLWTSLTPLVPQFPATDARHRHRCHLAEAWTAAFRLPSEATKCALVSCGVRDSLSRIFPLLKEAALEVYLPSDVYPRYAELAAAAELTSSTFVTLRELKLPSTGDVLLLPNPLHPQGRWLSPDETTQILAWLHANPRRRLLLDGVYTFDTTWHPSTKALYESGQCVLLHSFSKAWLRPQVFGIALVPAADRDLYALAFQNHSPPQANLQEAAWLLENAADLPTQVAAALKAKQDACLKIVSPQVAEALATAFQAPPADYLHYVPWSAEQLWAEHRLLTIPLSVFGSARKEGSILSILSF